MGSEWPIVKLDDFLDLKTGYPFRSIFFSDVNAEGEGIKLLRGDNIVQGQFRWAKVKYWPKNLLSEKKNAYFLESGDVILAMDRPWIEAGLKTAQLNKSDLPCLLVQRTARLRAKEADDQDFLRYVISSHKFVQYIKNVQTGTAIPHISPKQIRDFEFQLPPKGVRQKIGKMVKLFDSKIHLNRQINQTLEQMAQALFKSWFVDFDPVIDNALAAGNPIPDKLQAKAKQRQKVLAAANTKRLPDEIQQLFPSEFTNTTSEITPMNWVVSPLYELADYINGAAYKKFEPNSIGQGLPIIKIAELKNGVSPNTGFSTVEMPKKYLLENADILFSWSGNPNTSIDTFVWSHGPALLNQHIFKVVPKPHIPRSYMLSLLKYLKPTFTAIAGNKQTTGLGHVTVKNLKDLGILVPNAELLDAADKQLKPIWDQILNNILNNNNLTKLRDTLLPKLISGELKIPEAEQQLDAALA